MMDMMDMLERESWVLGQELDRMPDPARNPCEYAEQELEQLEGVVKILTAERDQLRQDVEAAMAFVEAWHAGMATERMWEQFASLAPALDRWRAAQEMGA